MQVQINQQIQQPTSQLQRQFEKDQFTAILSHLLTTVNIKTPQRANKVYDDIFNESGKVIGKNIIEAVQRIKQQDTLKQTINQEMQFYTKQIHKLQNKGISSISIPQYTSIFSDNYSNGFITQHITQHISNLDYISLQKLLKVINKFDNIYQKNDTNHFSVINLRKTNIFEDNQQYAEIEPIKIDEVKQYVNSQVIEVLVKHNILAMLTRLQKKQQEDKNISNAMKQIEITLRDHQQVIEQQLYQSNIKMDKFISENQRLRIKLKQYQEQVIALNKRYEHEIIFNIKQLQNQNQTISKQINILLVQNQQLKAKIDWFQNNYNELSKQYQKFIQKITQNHNKENQQKQQRIFIQRTTKQQLEDAQSKINRLRQQNSDLKQKNTDLVYTYENKISSMELKIKQFQQTNLAQRITYNYQNNSKIRNSFLDRSKLKSFNMNSIAHEKTDPNKKSVIDSADALKNYMGANLDKSAFKKKEKVLSINIQSDLQNINPSLVQSQLTSQRDDQVLQNAKQLKKDFENGKKIMTCLAFAINKNDSRYPIHLAISEDGFTYLDSKHRLFQTIKFSQLKKIIFCYHNTSWMVLKMKTNQKNQKGVAINDYVLNVLGRPDLIQFLHLRCAKNLFKEGVKISFEEQDYTWINAKINTNSDEVLLSNFENYYNIHRFTINNGDNLFEACMKQSSLFGSGIMILIVTSIGILVFQKQGDMLLQKNQQLKRIIPIIDLMQLQTINGNKILIKYKKDKTIYKIKFFSYSQTNKFKQIIQNFRMQIVNKKNAEIEKYSLFASTLNKSQVS